MKRAEVVKAVTALLEAVSYADQLSTESHCRTMGGVLRGSIDRKQLNQLHDSAHTEVGCAVHDLAKVLSSSGDDIHVLTYALLDSRNAGQERAWAKLDTDKMGTGIA